MERASSPCDNVTASTVKTFVCGDSRYTHYMCWVHGQKKKYCIAFFLKMLYFEYVLTFFFDTEHAYFACEYCFSFGVCRLLCPGISETFSDIGWNLLR